MESTLYKNKLRNKALKFQKALKKQNINISFNIKSFKDYFVKLDIDKDNRLLIYYKPTKNTYSLKKYLNNFEFINTIDSLWNKINNFKTYSTKSGIYEAFVDGSYIAGITGYGAIIYLGDEVKAELSGTIPSTRFRQFAGELKSVIETIKWCHNNNIKKIRINYDYKGIEKFITAEWKAKNNISKEYTEFILKSKVEIEWRHIKSHTGNIRNEKADFLAKNHLKIISKIKHK
jgi:ribonuclease HI